MKQKFDIITSTCVPLPLENVDTDQIIPARFLKATTREGFGENLFRDWRYDKDGNPKADFVMNSPVYKGEILVAGKNFGCGSSREHAAWALADYGFKAVISSFFADIFRNNALNNMLLPVQVSEGFLQKIFAALQQDSGTAIEIDLTQRCVSINGKGKGIGKEGEDWEFFPIGEYKQHCLMNRQMDIDYLVSTKAKIEQFEKDR